MAKKTDSCNLVLYQLFFDCPTCPTSPTQLESLDRAVGGTSRRKPALEQRELAHLGLAEITALELGHESGNPPIGRLDPRDGEMRVEHASFGRETVLTHDRLHDSVKVQHLFGYGIDADPNDTGTLCARKTTAASQPVGERPTITHRRGKGRAEGGHHHGLDVSEEPQREMKILGTNPPERRGLVAVKRGDRSTRAGRNIDCKKRSHY